MLGSRSFAVWTTEGELVFDSGDAFEQITAEAAPQLFNAPEDANQFDQRSDDRGPEPEHLVVGKVGGHEYAFIDFERIGGVVVYDITDPTAPEFVQYINNRNPEPGLSGEDLAFSDLEPEGMLFIPESESPIGAPLLAVAHERSDSTALFRIDEPSLSDPSSGDFFFA